MRKSVFHITLLLFFIVGCNNKKQESHENNSAQKQDEMNMGDMPGMEHQPQSADTSLQNVLSPTNKSVLSNAETIHPSLKNISQSISASGYIAFDERRNNIVAVRTGGRIEKLYVKLNYQYVHKGDKVIELYSPELNTYQEEYLHHLKTKSDSNLIEATKQKLKLLGLSEKQISDIETTGQELKSITVYSPYDGFILYDFAQQQSNSAQNNSSVSSGMSGMNGGANTPQSMPANQMQSAGKITEGGYVTKGQTLFVMNDCKEVYAIVAFDANDEAEIKIGAAVKIKSHLSDENINGNISFIEPAFKEGQKFIQVRVYLQNESLKLKINSIVNAELESTGKYLVVPSSSVLSLGNRKFVWRKKANAPNGNKVLLATEVVIGKEADGYSQIIFGIAEQDEIAKDAGYLLDSESLIKTVTK